MKANFNAIYTKLMITAIIICFANISIGQTHEKYYQDGKIYFKFKDHLPVNIPVNHDNSVDLDQVPMLNNFRDDFDITAMSRPFDLNNDSKLLLTFMLEFNRFEDVEELITALSQNPDLEYVEKVAREEYGMIKADSGTGAPASVPARGDPAPYDPR